MRHLTLIILLSLNVGLTKAQIVINEIMQSNVDCIMDDLNDFPDSWVELYNTGDIAVSLKDYRIGITTESAEGWKLPDVKIAPKMFALVYCDKAAKKMHTDFRLESGKGGGVWLFKGSEVVDALTELPKQPAPNIAYGRKTEGADEWGYQLEPTPGAINCGQTSDKLLGDPVFSETGKVIKKGAISLQLSLPEGTPEGAEIRYTTDGTEPTLKSTLYTGEISISGTKVIRARLFCEGWLSPRSVTQSYIFFSRDMTLPIISISTDSKYLNDTKIGIYVEGTYQKGKNNFDFNWRRPMNIEYFEEREAPSVINQLCEARIMGGATRGSALKSMAVYAHKRFGTKHFKYEFFPDQKPGLTEFKSILLRNSGNDFDYLYQRDAIMQRSMASHVDLDWQAWSPAIIYINGTYKGMLNIRERSNDDYVWANYQKLEDIDVIENWNELKAGDKVNFNKFKTFYGEHGHTLKEYAKWMDWEEFINLMVMNLYFNNQDFPGNNNVMWRPRTADGRWRWIAKDTDFGLGLYGSPADYKTIEWLYDNNYDWGRNWANGSDHTRLFRRLMDDADFNREFIDRCCIYMGDFLNEEGVRAIWDPMYDLIKYEYPHHRKLINEWWPNYNDELRSARNWLAKRTGYFYQQLGSFYKLGNPITLKINKNTEDNNDVKITFNGIQLSQGTFDGKFFSGRTLSIKGEAPEGLNIAGWKLVTISPSGSKESQLNGASCTFEMPQCSSLSISPILADASAINEQPSASWTWHKDQNRLVLTGVPEGVSVRLYDLRGMLLHSVVSDGADITLSLSKAQLHVLQVGEKTVKL